ncbi:vWA domain-containing protein [Aphanizomenon flos-aquae]|uniref:vWA domain-containing protein n=1 Tax=Aphanizomenon flos-aquae TaxID=1176 RepID=UPI000480E26A|nr:vWA domain-containing protein [Aphanizomenon flos-aquae]
MPYSAEISRTNPTAFLFAIDRSGSMSESTPEGMVKAQMLSDVMNRLFSDLILKCAKSEGIRNYFEVGVIGYDTTVGIVNPLTGALSQEWINPISLFETNPLRLEERKKKIPDGAGGIIETTVKFPVWFDPMAEGATPMCSALQTAYDVLNYWCATHPNAYPPLFVHITDGQSTDGDPEELAQNIQQLSTNDGNVLVFNIHLSSKGGKEVIMPSSVYGLPDNYAEKLFRMSSYLPSSMAAMAKRERIEGVSSESRCFAYNVQDLATLVALLDIGTRAAMDIVDMDR